MSSNHQTQVECDHCGGQEFVVYRNDEADDGPAVIYVECDACGASAVTARAEK